MPTFRLGDRIQTTNQSGLDIEPRAGPTLGATGTIIGEPNYHSRSYPVAFDQPIARGHNCESRCSDGYGWFVHETTMRHADDTDSSATSTIFGPPFTSGGGSSDQFVSNPQHDRVLTESDFIVTASTRDIWQVRVDPPNMYIRDDLPTPEPVPAPPTPFPEPVPAPPTSFAEFIRKIEGKKV